MEKRPGRSSIRRGLNRRKEYLMVILIIIAFLEEIERNAKLFNLKRSNPVASPPPLFFSALLEVKGVRSVFFFKKHV